MGYNATSNFAEKMKNLASFVCIDRNKQISGDSKFFGRVCTKTFGKIKYNTPLNWTFTENSKRILQQKFI